MKKISIGIVTLVIGLVGMCGANAAGDPLVAKSYADHRDSVVLQTFTDAKSVKNNVLADLADKTKQDSNYPTLQAAELIAETVTENAINELDGTATLSGDINQIKITQTNGKLDTSTYTVTVANNAITTAKIKDDNVTTAKLKVTDGSKAVDEHDFAIADGNGAVTWTDCKENEALVRSASGWICMGIAV